MRALAVALVLVAAGCGSTRTVTRTVTVQPPLDGQIEQAVYGHVVSAAPAQGGWLVRFDPAWWLGGIAANVAFAEAMHTTCVPQKCEAVPNDYFVLDDSHRTITYFLPRATTGRVLTRPLKFPGTRVDAARLVQYVRHQGNLFEPLDSGLWIRTRAGTIRAFAQQYRP